MKIKTPLDDAAIQQLRAGMEVEISGILLAARDQAHKRLCVLLDAGQPLPVDLTGQIIYFVGPTPSRPGYAVGAAGPTTASRMDAFSPQLLAAGLKGMIGKGYRGSDVRQKIQEYGAVNFSAMGGAGALLSKHVVASEIIAYEDLGTEAIRRLEVRDFPCVVSYDAFGGNVYETISYSQ
jgi:fumarate hydratase subunit beta